MSRQWRDMAERQLAMNESLAGIGTVCVVLERPRYAAFVMVLRALLQYFREHSDAGNAWLQQVK
jgi:hypothetical protein